MAGTRSSDRNSQSSPQSAQNNAGTKRKAVDSSPANGKSKRGRPSKEQKTLEETMPDDDAVMKEVDAEANGDGKADFKRPAGCEGWLGDAKYDMPEGNGNGAEKEKAKEVDKMTNGSAKNEEIEEDLSGGNGANATDQVKVDAGENGKTGKEDTSGVKESSTANSDMEANAIEEDEKREKALPSNVLEKGIIYFFTRSRVGVDSPDSVQDLARSYFVLRPLPDGAKLTDGAIQDLGSNRLVALPKKVWPKSGKDRFMSFTEKVKTSIETLKEEFFQGSEYTTKTTGTRHTPEISPIGEGVYAFTSTGGGQGTTHLAYLLTIPSTLGEVQKDVGIAKKGSFAISLKNPKSSSPANAQLAQGADYPDEVFDEFRGRGWMPAHPKHLDYVNAQMLLIGEDFDQSHNLDPTPKDENDEEKVTPQEEIERLESEDDVRVERLKGDDTIFADLDISSKEYSMMTTW